MKAYKLIDPWEENQKLEEALPPDCVTEYFREIDARIKARVARDNALIEIEKALENIEL